MELREVLRARRMTRAFSPDPIDADVLDRVLWAATRAPAAGNTGGTHLVVLEGPDQTARYWDRCLPEPRRSSFGWPRLLDAPVLVLALADPAAYLARYAEPDKAASGLGTSVEAWPVPYWQTDTAMAVENLLLAATDEGLGALFFGVFHEAEALLADLGVPAGIEPLGMVALGHPAPDRPGRSAGRGRPGVADVVHRGGW